MSIELDDSTLADGLKLFELSLVEDIGVADILQGVCCTTDALVPIELQGSASFVSRQQGVVSGLELCLAALAKWAPGLQLEKHLEDGDKVEPQQKIATFHGEAHRILVVERTCLNFLCRLSAIASLAAEFVERIQGTKAVVLDTRKTAPGWRRLEKYAVRCGGGENHRMGLFDAVMIKDNHLAFMNSEVAKEQAIPEAVDRARTWIQKNAPALPNGSETVLQVEVDTLEQLDIALQCQPDIVLLDNMSNDQLTRAVAKRDATAPGVLLEASGGVNLQTVTGIARTGVERISVGALTHSAGNFDIGLDWSM